MDCRTARLLLDFHRPCVGELPADAATDLERHLACCADCDAAGRTERRLDEYFGRAVRDVPVPDRLRERLLARLKAERTAVWRSRLAWGARGLSVAAALLLGVFAWWHWIGARPSLYVEPLVEADVRQYDDSLTPEKVEQWFLSEYDVKMIAPKTFKYEYLADYGLARMNGKVVPKLVFYHYDQTRTRARVFVLTREQFNLSALPIGAPEVETLGRKLLVDDCPDSADTKYLIIYDGDSLKPLQPDKVGI